MGAETATVEEETVGRTDAVAVTVTAGERAAIESVEETARGRHVIKTAGEAAAIVTAEEAGVTVVRVPTMSWSVPAATRGETAPAAETGVKTTGISVVVAVTGAEEETEVVAARRTWQTTCHGSIKTTGHCTPWFRRRRK